MMAPGLVFNDFRRLVLVEQLLLAVAKKVRLSTVTKRSPVRPSLESNLTPRLDHQKLRKEL